MKFRLFSPTQGETIAEAQVFYQTQLPWDQEELIEQAMAYLPRRWAADVVKSPLQYNVVLEDGLTIVIATIQKADARWPW